MVIKKFTGKTEEEATALAKKELGENVVIMNTRPLKRSGFFSFMKPQRYEVTVALEEEERSARQQVRPEDGKAKQPPMPSTAGLARAAASGQIPPLKVGENAPQTVQPADKAKTADPAQPPSLIEAKLDNLHALLEQRIMQTGAAPAAAPARPAAPQTAQPGAPAQTAETPASLSGLQTTEHPAPATAP
ncbi:MAG: hypothetical protein IK016_02290, partial [Lachnospiraceae bacterium]|nr:hypothetical protein [Lachnospiraceae bacterium]